MILHELKSNRVGFCDLAQGLPSGDAKEVKHSIEPESFGYKTVLRRFDGPCLADQRDAFQCHRALSSVGLCLPLSRPIAPSKRAKMTVKTLQIKFDGFEKYIKTAAVTGKTELG